jgi:hypothetical protein
MQPERKIALLTDDARFFRRLALALLLLTLLAFSTTYLLPVALGRFTGEPILHLHGVLFLLWPALFLAQTTSITRSRRWHRNFGLAGISLATAMLLTGFAAIGSSVETWAARGVGIEGQAISIVAFAGVLLFAIFFTLAIATIRDRASHSRLMALATLAMMQGAWGRLALLAATRGNPAMLRPGLLDPVDPARVMVVHLVFDTIVLAFMAFHDRRMTGRVHKVTLFGGAALMLVIATRHLFAGTVLWRAVAGQLAGF